MPEELQDEVTSINSIYGPGTLSKTDTTSQIYTLVVPAYSSISLRIEFPQDYPAVPPSILGTQSVGEEVAKGEGHSVVELFQDVLGEIFTPCVPCIFDLVEDAGQKLQQRDASARAESPGQQQPQTPPATHGLDSSRWAQHNGSNGNADPAQQQHFADGSADPPAWILSEVITEKKSIFVARAAAVRSVGQAKAFVGHLLATDKKVGKATHNITAWRIRGENGVQYQDCDDDGETAAGGRLLHLLELMGVWDVMVVVTRWYGGVHLGPDRFRLINQCARDALTRGDFAPAATTAGQDHDKEGGKKKGKK